ncbi:MAG: aromatic-ring-hydroxylating dioxygenase subunit beta [Gammaproteobacteria bacterium]
MEICGDDRALIEFVYHEARLIDEKRFEEWFDLYADDCRYWMPLMRDQPPDAGHTSLFDEDKLLLKIRIQRLRNLKSYSQAHPSWCQHILQAPSIERREVHTGVVVLRTPFLYAEYQQDRQEIYCGVAWHHLRTGAGKTQIAVKKIELLNRDAALPSLQLFP